MKKIFLDCGTHKGEGLLEFYKKGIINDKFEIHTFEANPNLGTMESIEKLKKDFINFPQNIQFYNNAVWISDGDIVFNNRNDHAAHISNIGFSYEGQHKEILIKSIDFSNFIDKLPVDSFIIVKMDIEGSEFEVLRHLIKTKTIKKIHKLYVEFHPNAMSNENENSANQLIDIIVKNKILFELWH
jgi:FkbM family methyltransferase